MKEKDLHKHHMEYIAAEPAIFDIEMNVKSILLRDKPDVIVTTKNEKKIGIEVIECHPSVIKTNGKENNTYAYKRIDYACEECTKLFRNEGKKHEFGHVYFKEEAYKTTMKANQFAPIVIEEIKRHIKNDKYINNPHLLGLDKFMEMRKQGEFDYVFVEGINIRTEPTLSTAILPSHAYWMKDMTDCYINRCIEEKEKKLVDYKKMEENMEIAEYWLVITLPDSEEYDFDKYVQQSSFDTKYERVYLTKWGHKLRLK